MNIKLNSLGKATLLVKAGFKDNLLEAKQCLNRIEVHNEPVSFPQGEEDCRSWYGGPNSGGLEGYVYYRDTRYVTLGEQTFSVTKEEVEYKNGSSYETNHERDYPDGDCPCCGVFYHIAPSTGTWEGDLRRVQLKELIEWANQFDFAAPEAVEILRKEIETLSV